MERVENNDWNINVIITKRKKKKELLILYTNWYLIKYRWNGEEEKAKEEGK